MPISKPASQGKVAPAPKEVGYLRQLRMLELDKEFRRQTKELSRLTKEFGKKLSDLSRRH